VSAELGAGVVGSLFGRAPVRSRARSAQWRRFGYPAAAALIAIVAFVAWTAFRLGGDRATIAVDDLGEAVAALVAVLSCGFAAGRSRGRMRWAWALLAASAATWCVGEVIWSVYEVGQGVAVPFPSAADAGYLSAIPLAVAGILAFPSAPSRSTTRAQALLDGTIVALSLVFIAWALGLANVYETSTGAPLAKMIGAAYPISDIVIISVLLLTIRRAGRHQRGAMLLLLVGLAANAVADSGFAYLNAAGTYQVTGSMVDAGWVIGYLMIALAPLWPGPPDSPAAAEGPIDVWQMSVPWIALLGAAVTAIFIAATNRGLDTVLTALGGGLGVLLVATQVLWHKDSLTHVAQLRDRTILLNKVVARAPLGLARVAVDMTVIEANPRLAQLLGTTPDKMAGTPVPTFLAHAEMTRVFEAFQPLWKGTLDTIESDSQALRADGTAVWVHWSATTVRKPGGRIDFFLVMFEDTTTEHEAEEAAMANLAGLERLNHLKSEFVSMVSHEFRTALVGIQGFSELLRDEELPRPDVKDLAADINHDAVRLNRMIGEMLDLDRMEAGKIHLDLKPVDLNILIREEIDRAQVTTDKHTITANLDPTLPVVSADSDRLVQVLANLLSNAVKYSPEGGDIVVTTRFEGGQVQVSVKDEGLGIPAEFINRLFGRYERFESNRASKVIGTGLGLAIARQIVELHGGRIWVDSTLGGGSTFYFTIPTRVG
jgi:PAS domain S-box-containing protein